MGRRLTRRPRTPHRPNPPLHPRARMSSYGRGMSSHGRCMSSYGRGMSSGVSCMSSRGREDNALVQQLCIRQREQVVGERLGREAALERERHARRKCRHMLPQLQHRVRVVGLHYLARAVGHAHLQCCRRCRRVDRELLGLRRGRAGAGTLVAHGAPLAAERLERHRRWRIRLAALIDDVHVTLCGAILAHELCRHLAAVDGGEEGRILWVVGLAERSVIHGKAILPEGDGMLSRRLGCRGAIGGGARE
mmetsp:Transcript_10431/g.26842  ORF Transcript_10431/g.26842 Transcript_10431/m.26842 type:complete len:249 (-) Transcript_10431:279-1025(-)